MADDVKVKFGGDFSSVADGANTAAQYAGTAMVNSFKDYGKSIMSSVASFMSVENLAGKLVSGVKDALSYFREVDQLSRKLGVSRVEMQQFGKLGVEVGVSMETMARSIQIANKNIGAAQLEAGKQRDTLIALGFTEKEITTNKVKAIDVMMKLAEQYDKNINSNTVAKYTTDMFGRSGQELNAILKEGTSAIKERIDAMKVYSDAEVKAAANADRAIERGQKALLTPFRNFAVNVGRLNDINTMESALERAEKKNLKEDWWSGRKRSAEDLAETPGVVLTMAKDMSDYAKKYGLGKDQMSEILTQQAIKFHEGIGGELDDQGQLMVRIAGILQDQFQNAPKAKQQEATTAAAAALSVSSLQAIGGGDIQSIFGGTYQDQMLDAQQRIANATTETALNTKTTPATTKPTTLR